VPLRGGARDRGDVNTLRGAVLEYGLLVGACSFLGSEPPPPPGLIELPEREREALVECMEGGGSEAVLTATFCFPDGDICVDTQAAVSSVRAYDPAPAVRKLLSSSSSAPPPPAPPTLPHFAPLHSVNLIPDESSYPRELCGGLELRRLPSRAIAHVPAVFMNNLVQTSDGYTPLLPGGDAPLALELDVSLGTSPARYRLLKHLDGTLASQEAWGFDPQDVDDIRRLVTDTSIPFLALTVIASVLHLMFELLAFREDVSFWSDAKTLRGLSVAQLAADVVCQLVLTLFMYEKGASLLVLVPQCGLFLIAAWKCRKAFGVRLVRGRWGLPTLTAKAEMSDELTLQLDRQASAVAIRCVLPLIGVYGAYELVANEHKGWYVPRAGGRAAAKRASEQRSEIGVRPARLQAGAPN
jgi:hypothetical protein